MSLNLKALTLTAAVFWGGCFFFVSMANLIWPSYGGGWLDLGESLYPGYNGPSGFGSVMAVTLYAFVDGAIAGAVFAWLYNTFIGSRARDATVIR